MLALTPVELIVTLIIALALFIWGPSKIPELARALGKAKKEFELAQKEYANSSSASIPQQNTNSETTLVKIATMLGIRTEGKTEEEIAKEIIERTKRAN